MVGMALAAFRDLVGFWVLGRWAVWLLLWLCGLWAALVACVFVNEWLGVMMRRLKVFGVALVALFVVGVMTAGAAFAESTPLPQVHTALPGENYPLNLLGQKTAVIEGEIALGACQVV